MKQIRVLLANDLIRKYCRGGWGSTIVLAPKAHQEYINDVKEHIWKMCISYKNLDRVTDQFKYPIRQ